MGSFFSAACTSSGVSCAASAMASQDAVSSAASPGQDAERAKGLEDVYIRQRREPLRDAGKLFFGGLVPKPVKAGKQ